MNRLFVILFKNPDNDPTRNSFDEYYMPLVEIKNSNKCLKDNSICFFEHQYRINIRSISREERLNMRNDNIKPWGISSLPWCGYADDLILFTLDINSLQKATNILDEVFSSYGLCINDAKTVRMILNHGYLQEEYPTSFIKLCNIPLQNSSEFISQWT